MTEEEQADVSDQVNFVYISLIIHITMVVT